MPTATPPERARQEAVVTRREQEGNGSDPTPRASSQAARASGRRILVLAIVVSLCASALLAIGILLFGRFGETEGRILGTTALIAGYGLLALPAGFLLEGGRRVRLAVATLILAATGLGLALAAIWSTDPPDALGKSVATVTAFAVAATQTSALTARRRLRDRLIVARLFRLSVALAIVLAGLVTVAVWVEDIGWEGYFRITAALAVLDVLVVVLQPVLAFARPETAVHRLHLVLEQGDEVDVEVDAVDFASAVANAVRSAERGGSRVHSVERLDGGGARAATPKASRR
jgi:MFS family permease